MSEKTMDYPSIQEWYSGKKIFITGSTGFMGKVLVEKLLRDCGDLERLFLLIRAKKGTEPTQRREEFINHMIFDNIRQKNPERFEKIQVIKGDITQDDLDISIEDRNLLINEINIIFHCAANVRFDQALREAANMNTLGTYRVLKLAENCKHLCAFVHCSTAYCQCNEPILEEKYYPPPHNPLGIAQMSSLLNDEILEMITPKLLNNLPNTYAYTKALTEGLIYEFKDKIPITIARPSIVTAAWREPMPGWVEGLNGPTGLMIGGARGVIRSMHCNPDYPADVIPVDITINAIIACAWERGLTKYEKNNINNINNNNINNNNNNNNNTNDNIIYRNVVSSSENSLTWGESIESGKKLFNENPLCFSLWYPNGSIKSNYYHHLLCVIFFHYLPAYLIDGLLILFRKKPFMLRVQKKVSMGLDMLQYYTTKLWIFKHDELNNLYKKMNKNDQDIFCFDTRNIDWYDFIRNYILGARLYLLKEKPETLPKARKLLKRLYYMDRLVTFLFYGLILWFLFSYCDVITNSFQFIFEGTKSLFVKAPIARIVN